MECKSHPGEQATLTCLECGVSFCTDCVKETGDTQYCPACHRVAVDRLAIQMGVKEKPSREDRTKADTGKERKRKASRRRSRVKGLEGLEEEMPALSVIVGDGGETSAVPTSDEKPDVTEVQGARSTLDEAEAEAMLTLEVAGPAEAVDADEDLVTAPEAAGAMPEGKQGRVKPAARRLRRPRVKHELVPRSVAADSSATPEPVLPVNKDEFWEETEAPGKRRLRRAAGMISMQLPDEYDGELTSEPSYLKAVLWALLVGALGAGLYGTVAWLKPSGVSGVFGWFIGFAVGIAVVLASGRHFNWKLGLIAAAVAVVFIGLGYVFSNILRFWFPRNAIEMLLRPPAALDRLRFSFTNLKDQFLENWWWVVVAITGATAFLMSFRPWPLKMKAGGPTVRGAGEASRTGA